MEMLVGNVTEVSHFPAKACDPIPVTATLSTDSGIVTIDQQAAL